MSFSFLAFYNSCILTNVPYLESLPAYPSVHSKKNPHRQSYPCASFKREEPRMCYFHVSIIWMWQTERWFSLSQPHLYCDGALKMVWRIRIPPQETKPSSGRDVSSSCHSHLPSPTLQISKRYKKSCKGREILSCLIHFHSQILFLYSDISSHLQLHSACIEAVLYSIQL